MYSLVLQEVTKRFSTANILHAISLSISAGERVAVVGESGAGKTTLLRLIAGLEQPTSGKIRLNDQDVTSWPANKRGVGVVFQDYATYPRLTVAENLTVSLVGGGMKREEKEERVNDVCQWLGLGDLLKRLPSELSGGQVQRVALGKVMVSRPKLLLLDEPFSQLDVRLAEQVRLWLSHCHERYGMTQIMVTHDPFDALNYVDKLAVLHRGELAQFASPDEVRRHPRTLFAAQLTSPCGINVLPTNVLVNVKHVAEFSAAAVSVAGASLGNGMGGGNATLQAVGVGETNVRDLRALQAMGLENRASVGIRPECIRLLCTDSNPADWCSIVICAACAIWELSV